MYLIDQPKDWIVSEGPMHKTRWKLRSSSKAVLLAFVPIAACNQQSQPCSVFGLSKRSIQKELTGGTHDSPSPFEVILGSLWFDSESTVGILLLSTECLLGLLWNINTSAKVREDLLSLGSPSLCIVAVLRVELALDRPPRLLWSLRWSLHAAPCLDPKHTSDTVVKPRHTSSVSRCDWSAPSFIKVTNSVPDSNTIR